MQYRDEPDRWRAYVREAIVEPAIGRDILALGPVRRPALLRQLFGVAVSAPASIVSLQKIRGQLHDAGALETIAHYQALLAAAGGIAPSPEHEPDRFGTWVGNACLAFAWNAGQEVAYWREEPWEVHGVTSGSWGRWAVAVKTGRVTPADLRGLLEFARRFPTYRPLVLCDPGERDAAARAGVEAMDWRDFLWEDPAARRA